MAQSMCHRSTILIVSLWMRPEITRPAKPVAIAIANRNYIVQTGLITVLDAVLESVAATAMKAVNPKSIAPAPSLFMMGPTSNPSVRSTSKRWDFAPSAVHHTTKMPALRHSAVPPSPLIPKGPAIQIFGASIMAVARVNRRAMTVIEPDSTKTVAPRG